MAEQLAVTRAELAQFREEVAEDLETNIAFNRELKEAFENLEKRVTALEIALAAGNRDQFCLETYQLNEQQIFEAMVDGYNARLAAFKNIKDYLECLHNTIISNNQLCSLIGDQDIESLTQKLGEMSISIGES